MDQASMHGEIAVYLTDPIAQQHIVIEQSTTLHIDRHAEGKLVENPGSTQNTDDSKMQQLVVDIYTNTSNVICKGHTELAQECEDESDNWMTSTSISGTKPNDSDIKVKSDASPGVCTSDNATINDRILIENTTTSITIDTLTTEGIADNAKFQQNVDETDTESPHTTCNQCTEPAQGTNVIEISVHTDNSESLRFLEDIEKAQRTNTICEKCTKLGHGDGNVQNSTAKSPMDNSKCPKFVQNLKNYTCPRMICKECMELEQGANEIENPMADSRTDDSECPQCFEEFNKSPETICKECTQHVQDVDEVPNDMTEMTPRFVREVNTESPNKICKACRELDQGANLIENPTNALALDTEAERGDMKEKRSGMPEPVSTPRVDISDTEQFAEKLSNDSPQFVKETRIEIPTKISECVGLAKDGDTTENPTEALAVDTQAEPDKFREKHSDSPDSPAYAPPDSGRVDNPDNEQFSEEMSIDSPQFVDETRIESPNDKCEERIELAQGANYATENPVELAFASDYNRAEFEKRSETPHDSPATYTPPDSGRVNIISENEQNPEEVTTIDTPKFTISDVTKLPAEGGQNESLINMCIILNPDQPDKYNELIHATDLSGGSGGGFHDMSSVGLEIQEKIEVLKAKYTEATQTTENLELNLWDLTEKIRLLQCKIEKQEQQINDAQSKQVEQERILLSPMRNIYLRQFHDQIREGIAKKLSQTALYGDHHKRLCLRVQTDKEISHRFGIEHFFDADLWSLMNKAHTRAPKFFSRAALWNHFVSDVLEDSASLEELGLSAAAVRITKFGCSPDAEDNSCKALLRNKVVYAELLTRQDEEQRPASYECYEFLFNVPPESINIKPSVPLSDTHARQQSDAPSMQTMAEKLKQPLEDFGTSGGAFKSFSSTTSTTSEDSE